MKPAVSKPVAFQRSVTLRSSAIVLGAVLAVLATGCAGEPSLPEELAGTYTASDPRYAGRYLELSAQEVVFGLGDAGFSKHLVEFVSLENDQGQTIYTLAYAGEGGTDRLSFYEPEGRRGSIVLRNQSGTVWTKQGGGK